MIWIGGWVVDWCHNLMKDLITVVDFTWLVERLRVMTATETH